MNIPQTGIAALDWFLSALDAWGYLIVFGFTVLENLFIVGSLTPGETVVIAGAFVASRGGLAIAWVWVASLLGTITGANLSYVLGRRAGLPRIRAFTERFAATRIGRLLRIDAAGIDEVQTHFDEHGSKFVLISRFAVAAKNFVPALAGATGLNLFWFEFYVVVGGTIYTSLMCLIGWFLGSNLDRAVQVAGTIGWFGLAILALFVVVLYFMRNRLRSVGRDGELDDPPADDALLAAEQAASLEGDEPESLS